MILKPFKNQQLGQVLRLGLIAGLCTLPSLANAQTVIHSETFNSGTGSYSSSGSVSTGGDATLRGGLNDGEIVSPSINISGNTNLVLDFDRSTTGFDLGESGNAEYSIDGGNWISLESVSNASGGATYNLPTGNTLQLRFYTDASSYFENYTVDNIQVTAGSTGGGGGGTGGGGGGTGGENCTSTLTPGDHFETMIHNGLVREYIISVPNSYTGNEDVPLLLDFHPLLSDNDFQFDNSGTRELAEDENFIVVYPNGIDNAWNVGPCCTESRSVDDVGFALEIVNEVKANACIDDRRVYATGYSNGGGMSYALACNAADTFAAVAPASFDLIEEMSCNPSRPISVFSERGTFDFIVPYDGGASNPPTPYNLDTIHFLGAEGTFDEWADLNQCSGNPQNIGGGCEAYENCAGGARVVLCTVNFGSHSAWDAEDSWDFLRNEQLP